jgi:hypothetical protein
MRHTGETLRKMMNCASPPVKCPRRTPPPEPDPEPYRETGEVTMSSTSQFPSTSCIVTVTWSL